VVTIKPKKDKNPFKGASTRHSHQRSARMPQVAEAEVIKTSPDR
jgi:hypothetical protein